mmetsp:Transcript_12968/g.34717  ORF Transcript_12968/g.34717 Transcript_12968/m.34717 type:complete len:227 (-) Transcript_12968:112-792(-)
MGQQCCSEISKAPHQVALPPEGASSRRGSPESGERLATPMVVAASGNSALVENDQFISQVGDMPKFDKAASRPRPSKLTRDEEATSEVSSGNDINSELVEGMTAKESKQQAKALVKDFVREMVKGRKVNVMKQNGQLTMCTVTLARALDRMSIKAGTAQRTIKLKQVEEIHPGADVEGTLGIDTPLDDLCATLMLAEGDCITFRLQDINDRDTFVCCLLMFCNSLK